MSETVTDEDGVVLYPAGLVAQAEREAERLDSVSGVSALLRGLSRALATAQAEIRLLNETAAKPRAVTLADVWAAYEAGVHSGQHHPTADEALIRKAADAYVKSQFDYDPDTGALLRADTQRAEAAEARERALHQRLADAEQRADYEARCVNQEKDHARALAAECARLREALGDVLRAVTEIGGADLSPYAEDAVARAERALTPPAPGDGGDDAAA